MKKLFILITALALLAIPTSAFAQGGGTLVGGFDVGPGGLPQTTPWIQTAGNTWLIKIWSPLGLDCGEPRLPELPLKPDEKQALFARLDASDFAALAAM